MDRIRDISISPKPSSTPPAQNDRLPPPEMLTAIFVLLSKRKHLSLGRKDSHFVQDLVSVTHVGRFWRQVAINAPELWNEIMMRNVEAIKVFLGRSNELPLSVDLFLLFGDVTETTASLTRWFHTFTDFGNFPSTCGDRVTMH